MKDIKERVRDKNPKIRNPAADFRKNWFAQRFWKQKKSQGNYMKKAVGSQNPQHSMELKK
ncbi:hypothetical protein [Holdemanella porci]|uniref:hypothetical protein n=1 Tax=Holdemanella porci TaxID=2652276 RepID=UPI0022E40AFA|nr:hypothetical protein [Holdemanella porci]